MKRITANDYTELREAIIDFFGNAGFIETIKKGVPEQNTDGEIVDIEDKLSLVLPQLSMFFNNNYIADKLFPPRIDLAKQEKLATKLIREGFEKTYSIGDDIYALRTKECKDENKVPYKEWHMVKHIENGRRKTTIITDYYTS